MKKKVLLQLLPLILLGSFIQTASTQNWRFGFKVGAGLFNLHFSEPNSTLDSGTANFARIWYERKNTFRPTLVLGGIAEIAFTEKLMFSAGLNLTPKYTRFRVTDTEFFKNDFSMNLLYVQVPATIHYTLRKVYFGVGSYLSFCTAGQWKDKFTNVDPTTGMESVASEKFQIMFGREDSDSNFRRFDFGARAEVSLGLKTVRLSLAYDYGIANNLPSGTNANGAPFDGKLNHQAVYALLTYIWGTKK